MTTRVSVEELGIELRRVRKKRGLSLRDIRDEIGVSPATLSRIENQNPPDSKKILQSVADWLGVVLETGEGSKSRGGLEEVRRSMEVYLRAEKNLPEEVARAIADAAEAVMEFEVSRRSDQSDAED